MTQADQFNEMVEAAIGTDREPVPMDKLIEIALSVGSFTMSILADPAGDLGINLQWQDGSEAWLAS